MTETLAKGEALMKSAIAKKHHGATWHNQCASFVCCMISGIDSSGSGIGASADTARQALDASGPLLSSDGSAAVPGVIGWWSNGATGDGHVAVYVGGGKWAMGSDAVNDGDGVEWGDDSGTISLARYRALKPAMVWRGFTADFVGQIFADKRILVKAAGHPEIYEVVGADTLHHLTPAEYAALKTAGVHYVEVPSGVLPRFSKRA
jgi:hypothetical protein